MITMPDLQTALLDTMEMEWNQAIEFQKRQEGDPFFIEAGRLVAEHFSALDRLGMIRMRESRYYRPELQLGEFMSALQELFSGGGKPVL